MPDPRPCRSCGKPIVFIATPAGKQLPCDAPVLSVVTDAGEVVRGRAPHWASCPAAAEWRKKKAQP